MSVYKFHMHWIMNKQRTYSILMQYASGLVFCVRTSAFYCLPATKLKSRWTCWIKSDWSGNGWQEGTAPLFDAYSFCKYFLIHRTPPQVCVNVWFALSSVDLSVVRFEFFKILTFTEDKKQYYAYFCAISIRECSRRDWLYWLAHYFSTN